MLEAVCKNIWRISFIFYGFARTRISVKFQIAESFQVQRGTFDSRGNCFSFLPLFETIIQQRYRFWRYSRDSIKKRRCAFLSYRVGLASDPLIISCTIGIRNFSQDGEQCYILSSILDPRKNNTEFYTATRFQFERDLSRKFPSIETIVSTCTDLDKRSRKKSPFGVSKISIRILWFSIGCLSW